MAYPTGSGSEQLYNGTMHVLSNSESALKFDGTQNSTVGTNSATVPALHIITVLNVVFCEQGNAAEGLYMYVHDGTSEIRLLENQSIPAYGTFVWNDNIVLRGGDRLTVHTVNSANIDVYYSYIDQDWS